MQLLLIIIKLTDYLILYFVIISTWFGHIFYGFFRTIRIFKKSPSFDVNDIGDSLRAMEILIARYYVFNSRSFDEYCSGRFEKKRMAVIIIMKTLVMMLSIRLILLSLFDNHCLKYYLVESIQVVNEKHMLYMAFAVTVLAVVAFGSVQQYFETKFIHYIFVYMAKIKNNDLQYRLSRKYSRRYAHRCRIVAKYVSKIMVNMAMLTIGPILIGPLVHAYIETPDAYNLPIVIFWVCCTTTFVVHGSSLAIFGTLQWYLALLHLTYQFEEVNELIKRSYESNNTRILFKAMHKHNHLVKLTEQLNHFLKYGICIIYYLSPICQNLFLYIISDTNNSQVVRAILLVILLIFSYIIILTNSICALVRHTAHKSRTRLYKSFTMTTELKLSQKFKLIAFIEELSEHDIGFYCYDFFPMNNYEFYQYITNSLMNYFLLASIISLKPAIIE